MVLGCFVLVCILVGLYSCVCRSIYGGQIVTCPLRQALLLTLELINLARLAGQPVSSRDLQPSFYLGIQMQVFTLVWHALPALARPLHP